MRKRDGGSTVVSGSRSSKPTRRARISARRPNHALGEVRELCARDSRPATAGQAGEPVRSEGQQAGKARFASAASGPGLGMGTHADLCLQAAQECVGARRGRSAAGWHRAARQDHATLALWRKSAGARSRRALAFEVSLNALAAGFASPAVAFITAQPHVGGAAAVLQRKGPENKFQKSQGAGQLWFRLFWRATRR